MNFESLRQLYEQYKSAYSVLQPSDEIFSLCFSGFNTDINTSDIDGNYVESLISFVKSKVEDEKQINDFLYDLDAFLRFIEIRENIELPSVFIDRVEDTNAEKLFDVKSSDEENAGEDGIDDSALDKIVSSLPQPLVEHTKRCRMIAAFIIERINKEEWFFDYSISEESLLRAVYYHDIGKANLQIDDYYIYTRSSAEEKARYYAHTNEGLNVLAGISSAEPEKFPPTSPDGVLRDAVLYHHERPDGKGLPEGRTDKEIPLSAKLTAVCDILDHLLYFGKTEEVDFDKALSDFISLSGKRIDSKLADVIIDNREVFQNYFEEIKATKANASGKFGMEMEFQPFFDRGKKKVFAYGTELYLNDPFYGKIKAEPIVTAMSDDPKLYQFEKLAVDHLCTLVCNLNGKENQLPLIIMNISFESFMRSSFLPVLQNIAVSNGNPFDQFAVCVKESDIIDSQADISDKINLLRQIGIKFGISEFGGKVTLLPSINTVRPDLVIMKSEYGKHYHKNTDYKDGITAVLQAAKKYNFKVLVKDVDNDENFKEISKIGEVFIGGPAIASALKEQELKTLYNK